MSLKLEAALLKGLRFGLLFFLKKKHHIEKIYFEIRIICTCDYSKLGVL